MSITEIAAAALISASPLAMLAQAQEPKTSVREMVTVSGTVERADRSTRTLTLRTSPSTTQIISVAPEVKLFDELQTGDKITVRLSESVIAAVRPGEKPSVAVDTTATATPRDPSQRSEVLQQVKAGVTVESVDRQQNLIVYKTADNRRVIRAVIDPRLLDGLKAGDVVEITYTRERAVDLQRAR
jgi:arginine repressor